MNKDAIILKLKPCMDVIASSIHQIVLEAENIRREALIFKNEVHAEVEDLKESLKETETKMKGKINDYNISLEKHRVDNEELNRLIEKNKIESKILSDTISEAKREKEQETLARKLSFDELEKAKTLTQVYTSKSNQLKADFDTLAKAQDEVKRNSEDAAKRLKLSIEKERENLAWYSVLSEKELDLKAKDNEIRILFKKAKVNEP